MEDDTRMKPRASQLQPNEAAFLVGNFHAREQPQLQSKDAAFSMKSPVRDTLGSSARRRPLEPQLLQMNTSFSVGMEPLWQPKKAAFSVGQKQKTGEKKLGKGSSQLDKRTRSMVHESNQEFGQMIREKLQEFAMILSKEYHYHFPTEYFEDYHGSFIKEDFLKMEQPKEKARNREADSLPISNVEWKKCTDSSRIIKGKCNISNDIGGECHYPKRICDEQINKAAFEEAKADPLPLVVRARMEGSDGVPNQNSFRKKFDGGAYKAANHVKHESEEKLELDRPIVTKDFSKEEGRDNAICGDHCSYLLEDDISKLEGKDGNGGSVLAADEKYEANKDLRISGNFQKNLLGVKDTPIEDTSTKEKEDIGKIMGKFFVDINKTFAASVVLISIGKQQHRTKFQPAKQFDLLSTVREIMVEVVIGQMELILRATKNGRMAGTSAATNHDIAVFGGKDMARQKKRKVRDENKTRRRRKQIIKAGIG